MYVQKIYPDAKLPDRANPTDSGADIFAYKFERVYDELGETEFPADKALNSIILKTGDRVLINTGIKVSIRSGYEIQVRPRSGNALKRGLTIVNTPGTIDCSYRGPVGVIMINTGHEPQEIKIGDKIAQLVDCPVGLSNVVEVANLEDTDRGEGGFGSTGT